MSDLDLMSMTIGCNIGDYQVGDRLPLMGIDWMVVSCITEDCSTLICELVPHELDD